MAPRPDDQLASYEGATQTRNGRQYRFTNGRWVDVGPAAPPMPQPFVHPTPPDQSTSIVTNELPSGSPRPETEEEKRARLAEQGKPGPPGGTPVVNPPPPVVGEPPPNQPPPVTGPIGASFYAPDSKNYGIIMRFTWDAATNQYKAERPATAAEWQAIQAGSADGKFYGDSTHEYGASSDGRMVDRTMSNEISNRTRLPSTSAVQQPTDTPRPPAPLTRAWQGNASVVSGRTGTGPIQMPVATPGPMKTGPAASPWRPKPTQVRPGYEWVWEPVPGRWHSKRVATPPVVPGVELPSTSIVSAGQQARYAPPPLRGVGSTSIVDPFKRPKPPVSGGARTIMA